MPTDIAFDFHNNLWISYEEELTISQPYDSYSPGGIRIVELGDFENGSYDWFNSNPLSSASINCLNANFKLNDINVWFIDVGIDKDGYTVLWVLSDYGVMGYIIQYNYSTHFNILTLDVNPIRCEFYFSNIAFEMLEVSSYLDFIHSVGIHNKRVP